MPRKQKPTHARYEICVAGSGAFPIDMLRYDQCAPRTSADSTAIWEHHFRVVQLNMYSAAGVGRPEAARWESFNWYVLTDDEQAAYYNGYTAEHIRINHLRDALALRQGQQTAAGNFPRREGT